MFTKPIFNIQSSTQFDETALAIFRYQAVNNQVYKRFLAFLNTNVDNVKTLREIPFLPIEFFKSHKVVSNTTAIEEIFISSGTTSNTRSKHHIKDISVYEKSYLAAFKLFYGDIADYTILALLPTYMERQGSSLIYMVNDLITRSNSENSGFYLDKLSDLKNMLVSLDEQGGKILLIGVSFALLDLIEKYDFELKNTIVMETGGMKGRRKEMIRHELHEKLKKGFGVDDIHSEYGMTELLSQAYSKEKGIFRTPSWMKVLIRDTEDALQTLENGKTGGINIIDLANFNSCSFIATQDLGRRFGDGSFEVLGRFDHSDIRGCNLLIN